MIVRHRRDRGARAGPAAAGRPGAQARPAQRRASGRDGVRRAGLRWHSVRWPRRPPGPRSPPSPTRDVAIATAVAPCVLFAVAPAQGWLQGELRFGRYAVVSVLEVAARVVFSVLAVLAGRGRGGSPDRVRGGWAGAVLAARSRCCATSRWRPGVLRERVRWAETGDIALVQFVVSVLVGADVVLVALLGTGTVAEAGFQALATLAKGPVYVAAGTVLVVFPMLRGAGDAADAVLRAALALVPGAGAGGRGAAGHASRRRWCCWCCPPTTPPRWRWRPGWPRQASATGRSPCWPRCCSRCAATPAPGPRWRSPSSRCLPDC